MRKAKQPKRNTNSPKQPPTLKKGNRRKAGKREVNQALIENIEHRLEQFHSILIHKRIEVNPVRDEGHLRELEESYHRKSKHRAEMQNTTNGIFEP